MTRTWPAFITKDLEDGPEGDAEMMRRWETYDREMRALIAAGGVHQDVDGWWVDDATGDLIGPDPEIERPMRDHEAVAAVSFAEAFPEIAAGIRRRGVGRKPRKEVVTLRLDADLVSAFKADGAGWQSRINDTLRKVKGL